MKMNTCLEKLKVDGSEFQSGSIQRRIQGVRTCALLF